MVKYWKIFDNSHYENVVHTMDFATTHELAM